MFMTYPILYSFRRCPYAMRARLALFSSRRPFILREILLKDKPPIFTELSPKATVPVLHLPDGTILEESLDIVRWVFANYDEPHPWAFENNEITNFLDNFEQNFKSKLDGYKYGKTPEVDFESAYEFLQTCEAKLKTSPYLFSSTPSLADIAFLPFLRQFANVDKNRFWALPLPNLHARLQSFLDSALFQEIIKKRNLWQESDCELPEKADFKPDLES